VADDLRAMPEPLHSRAWWRAWARWFAEALLRSPSTPLHPARWALAVGEHRLATASSLLPSPRRWQSDWPWSLSANTAALFGPDHIGWVSWIGRTGEILRLRDLSPPEDARVRAWRKRARDGSLPPLLLLLVRGMGVWLLLDGHDRLRAALEENVSIPVLHLFASYRLPNHGFELPTDAAADAAARQRPGWALDAAQRELMRWTDQELFVAASHAWPLPGGSDRWREEVGARLASLGLPPNHPIVHGLTPYEAFRRG
jgi:hypothetical protein